MKEKPVEREKHRGIPLLVSIVLVFIVLGTTVYAVAQKTTGEMSEAAIQNLSESLDLIQYTIEAIFRNQTEFQELIAGEAAAAKDPAEYIRTFQKNETMVKMAFIPAGKTEGVSNTGEIFSEKDLDFSAGHTMNDMPVSKSYVNYMGAWAHTVKCPVRREDEEIGTLYVEYIYESMDRSLPDGFYNKQATLYVMDAESERFILTPKRMGKRNAGHLNLDDFYRANEIVDPGIRAEVARSLKEGTNILFYHDIRGVSALIYMWSVNDGTIFLVGYVPVEAIQQEGRSVNQSILLVVTAMLVAFLACVMLYYFNWSQQDRIRKEREAERKLHNIQLAEALRAAQIASSSKTMFLSNMSHDIRTPMNAVLGFTTLLAKDADDPVKVREYTKKITASGQHLLGLINDVLDVSKIESGKVVLNFEKFTLNDVISSVEAIILPMAKAKGQEFHVEVSGIRHEYLEGDETRLNQILINLLSNAVKYTQEGGHIRLRILGLKQYSAQYEHMRIEVEDDGYGMTPEYLETIFEPFTRAENSTTNKVQGTGLGMAITKSIVGLMGGTIDVSSELNRGSIFTVELELRIQEGQEDSLFWKTKGISRILIVDEDPENCDNVRELMQDTGVMLDAMGIERALNCLQGDNGSCQLVLVDWDVEKAEGIEAVKALRRVLPDAVPILLLAEYDTEGIEEALRVENTHLLTKPFFVSALREKIAEIWKDGESREEMKPEEAKDLEGLHFLAAEDNEINAEILIEVLKMEGATCEVAENGRLAVERFEKAPEDEFDAILMDVQMPVMNGYEATRAIRSLEKKGARQIPIIAMTANAFAEDEKEALAAGMNAHVAKPLDVEVLRKVIGKYVG